MIDEMPRKTKKVVQEPKRPFLFKVEESMLEELKEEAAADPRFDSQASYMRWLLRTHPDRPANKKK